MHLKCNFYNVIDSIIFCLRPNPNMVKHENITSIYDNVDAALANAPGCASIFAGEDKGIRF